MITGAGVGLITIVLTMVESQPDGFVCLMETDPAPVAAQRIETDGVLLAPMIVPPVTDHK